MPVVYSFALQPFFHNPAANFENKMELNTNFHSYLGDFSDLNQTYVSLFYRLKDTKENTLANNRRAIGGTFLHEATGDFIDKSRLYLALQEQVLLNEELWLRFGAQFGVLNYTIHSLGFSPGGSAWNYDASAGINLGAEKWSLGAVMHQFPNSELTPILYTYTLNRYFEILGNKEFDLSPYLTYSSHMRVQLNGKYTQVLLSNSFKFKEQFGANATWNINKGVSFLGFYTFKKYQFFVNYFFPTNQGLKNVDAMQYELGVNFILN